MAPTDQAWQFFMEHLDEIRSCVQLFTKRAEYDKVAYDENPTSYPIRYTMADFDDAVNAKDHIGLIEIMNDAWFRAPNSEEVYDVPGFRELSDLLDGSVAGFVIPD